MSRIDFLGAIICAFPFSLADIKQGSLFKFKFCRCTTFVKQTKHTHFFLVLFSKQTVSFLLKFQWTIDWNCKHMRARLELVNIADIDHWKANKRSYWSGHLNGSNCSEWLNVARINKHIACLFTCLVHHWDDWTKEIVQWFATSRYIREHWFDNLSVRSSHCLCCSMIKLDELDSFWINAHSPC